MFILSGRLVFIIQLFNLVIDQKLSTSLISIKPFKFNYLISYLWFIITILYQGIPRKISQLQKLFQKVCRILMIQWQWYRKNSVTIIYWSFSENLLSLIFLFRKFYDLVNAPFSREQEIDSIVQYTCTYSPMILNRYWLDLKTNKIQSNLLLFRQNVFVLFPPLIYYKRYDILQITVFKKKEE